MRDLQAARGAALRRTPPGPTPSPAPDSAPDPGGPAGSARLPTGGPTGLPRRRTAVLALTALVGLALDIATKVAVVRELEDRGRTVDLVGGARLAVSRNPGAAFSFAAGATVVFSLVAVAVVVVIVRAASRLRSTGWAVALGLLLGGALGNLVDRVFRSPGPFRGAVVDFIDLRVWPVFNVADSCIVVGGLLAVLLTVRGVELDGGHRTDPDEPSDGPRQQQGDPAEPADPA